MKLTLQLQEKPSRYAGGPIALPCQTEAKLVMNPCQEAKLGLGRSLQPSHGVLDLGFVGSVCFFPVTRGGHTSSRRCQCRKWTYRTCRADFRAARKLQADLLIFGEAPVEMIYADRRPAEYTAGVLAAALREAYAGPIFLQGDRVEANASAYAKDPAAETKQLTDLTREQLAASYYNIDVDGSWVVDLSHPTLVEQGCYPKSV